MPPSLARQLRSSAGLPTKARALIDAVTEMSTDLDLGHVLHRIVASAAALTDAQYAALGVIGSDGDIAEFVTTGTDDPARQIITDVPPSLIVPLRVRGTLF